MPSPGDFFVGIADFFGSLVPGLVLTGGLWDLGTIPGLHETATVKFADLPSPYALPALVVVSYLVGQLVSVVASTLDSTYDAVRQLRWPGSRDRAFNVASKFKNEQLGEDKDSINTFQWCRMMLLSNNDAGYGEVERLESASKLFRSMVVVGIVLSFAAAIQGELAIALACVGLSVLSFFPYVDRRYKATETAYRLAIVTMRPNKSDDAK